MEKFEAPINTSRNEEQNRDIFLILDASLRGKNEEDLTHKQKLEEERFCRNNLEKLIELIEQEKVMAHATRAPMKVILKEGLLSTLRRNEDGDIDTVVGDIDNFQYRNMQVLIKEAVNPFLTLYKEYLSNSISQDVYEEEKQKIIEKVPTIGRKRVAHFLNIVIPKIIDKSGFPEIVSSNAIGLLHNSIRTMRKREKAFKMTTKGSADALFWDALAAVIGGDDLISAVHGSSLKKKFKESDLSPSSALGGEQGYYDIYFDTPDEVRLFDISGGDKWKVPPRLQNYDVAVSSRIRPEKFQAIRFGSFDKEKRVLYFADENSIKLEDLENLIALQKSGLLLFDSDLSPIPPLTSIEVKEFNDKAGKINNWQNSFSLIRSILEEKGYGWGKETNQ